MKRLESIKPRLTALLGNSSLARARWQAQRVMEQLGRAGLLSLGASVVLVAHYIVTLPEKGDLRRKALEFKSEMHTCSPTLEPTGVMGELRAKLRLDTDPRKLDVMGELTRSGLLLVDIQYQGEDIIDGRLRQTSLDISAIGSYQDLSSSLRNLADHPLLRLESLSLERHRPENMLLNVKLRLSMLGAV